MVGVEEGRASFSDLFVCAPGKKRLRWADRSPTHLDLSLATPPPPPELQCEQPTLPAKEGECSEIIFLGEKKTKKKTRRDL